MSQVNGTFDFPTERIAEIIALRVISQLQVQQLAELVAAHVTAGLAEACPANAAGMVYERDPDPPGQPPPRGTLRFGDHGNEVE